MLIVDHDDKGTVGVVLNRPTQLTAADVDAWRGIHPGGFGLRDGSMGGFSIFTYLRDPGSPLVYLPTFDIFTYLRDVLVYLP